MREFFRQFYHPWRRSLAIACILGMMLVILYLGMRYQTAEYERLNEATGLKTIEVLSAKMKQMTEDIKTLQLQNLKSMEDRAKIKQSMQQLKEDVQKTW